MSAVSSSIIRGLRQEWLELFFCFESIRTYIHPLNVLFNFKMTFIYGMQCQISCSVVYFFIKQWRRGQEEDVPELRISLQLQHRRVCVPLQRPDVTSRGGKRGHACLQTDTWQQTHVPIAHINTTYSTTTMLLLSPTHHLSRKQIFMENSHWTSCKDGTVHII